MKILITSDWYAPVVNGVVTSVLNLRQELLQRGHEVRVLTLSQSKRSFCDDGVTYIGSITAGKLYPGARLRSARGKRLVQELIDWQPDIIHSQCEFSTFLLAKKIAATHNIPVVHTYHTVYEDYTHYFSPSRRWGRHVVSRLSKRLLSKISCVIAPTEKVRTLLLGYGVARPIYVVPTGIDLHKFSAPTPPERLAQLRHSLGIPAENLILLYVGRLAEEKNVEELLAYRAALARRDVTLLLVGGGPYRAQLLARTKELNLGESVVFAGMVAPNLVADYYHLADLFVSASSSETQGLTYIEALAASLPTLCRKDSCLDGIIEDGQNGWQYQTQDEFLGHLSRFLAKPDLRESMKQAASESAIKFSAEHFAEAAEAVYLEQVSSQRVSP